MFAYRCPPWFRYAHGASVWRRWPFGKHQDTQFAGGDLCQSRQPKSARKLGLLDSTVCSAETHCLSDRLGVTRMVLVSALSPLRAKQAPCGSLLSEPAASASM